MKSMDTTNTHGKQEQTKIHFVTGEESLSEGVGERISASIELIPSK